MLRKGLVMVRGGVCLWVGYAFGWGMPLGGVCLWVGFAVGGVCGGAGNKYKYCICCKYLYMNKYTNIQIY